MEAFSICELLEHPPISLFKSRGLKSSTHQEVPNGFFIVFDFPESCMMDLLLFSLLGKWSPCRNPMLDEQTRRNKLLDKLHLPMRLCFLIRAALC